MKPKILIFSIVALIFTALSLQCSAQNHPNGHDSDIVHAAVNGGIQVAETVTGHAPLIPFIPDSVLGGMISSVIFAIWRVIEKRKLRKEGKLLDKPDK